MWVFEDWTNPPDAVIYRPTDRAVEVDTVAWLPSGPMMSLAPKPVREHGLKFDAFHPGRQIAWVRLSHGPWLAVVEVEAVTRDGLNQVRTVLWLLPTQLRIPPEQPAQSRGTKGRRVRDGG
ncbi:hypothetical protein [Mycolicibacterium llatzerense]|uniref:hypothetical protein n=1 Tax=Mycolicibacterium llatzerense TaxID=280871 RepID=UPI000A8D34A3|nr:hypothetical protein [Mycolicibacterium llatzerense]